MTLFFLILIFLALKTLFVYMKKLAKLVEVTSSRGQVPFSFPEFFHKNCVALKLLHTKEQSEELLDMISDPYSILYFK